MFCIGDYIKSPKLHKKMKLRGLTQQELQIIQKSILDIYKDVLYICEKYDFKVMMGGGNAIGAIRHKGFIPWDDDMDMFVSRDEYYPFLEFFCKEFGDKYYITSPFDITQYKDYCIHIIRKDITYISLFDYSSIYPNGLAIDICTYENVPDNIFLRVFHGFISDSLLFITNSIRMNLCRNKYSDIFFCLTLKSRFMYYSRLFIGRLFSFKNYSTWCFYLDKWISLFYKRRGKLITIPTGQLHYWGEMVPYDMFYPARECLFEGLKAYVFNKVDEFLKVRYGKDYMVVPPEEKREVHPVVAFSCEVTSKRNINR